MLITRILEKGLDSQMQFSVRTSYFDSASRVASFIGKLPEGDAPAVLVMSGTHEPESIQKVNSLGAAGFIPKSALRDTLLFRVESLLAEDLTQASVG